MALHSIGMNAMNTTIVSFLSFMANGPFAKQVDSFTPAHSAFGLPIYVAPLPAGSIQRVCHDTLPWLISISLDPKPDTT